MKLADSPFQKGLYIKVPKGTPLISRWHGAKADDPKTTRDVVVEISSTDLPGAETMLTAEEIAERKRRDDELTDELRVVRESLSALVHYPARTVPGARGGSYTYPAYDNFEVTPENKEKWEEKWREISARRQDLMREYQILGESRFGQEEILVSWSKDKNTTFAKYVELTEKPEARKKEPKVNIRQQMVHGSRWKFTQDVDIYYDAPNGAYHDHVKEWDDANPRPDYDHTDRTPHDQWYTAREAMREAAQKSLGLYVPKLYRSIKAGETFTVEGKFNSYFNPHGWDGRTYTNTAVVLFDGETKHVGLEYSMIKDFIEAVSIPTVDVYVLRQKATGLFFKSTEYNEEETKIAQDAARARGEQLHGIWHEYAVYTPELVEAFMKAKHFDGLGRAKTQILMMTGYYNDLPGADESLPEWAGGNGFKMDASEWELVHFDKLGRKEVGIVPDFEQWYKRAWELRALTVKYGSSVRTAYKELEKKNLLDTQKGMLVFTVTDEEKRNRVGHYGDKTAVTPEDDAVITQTIETAGLKKGTFKKAKDSFSVAVSFPNKGAALMAKLAYNGGLKVTVIDLEDMKEAVDG